MLLGLRSPRLRWATVVACLVATSTSAQVRTAAPAVGEDSPLRGGVPTGDRTSTPLALSIGDVIDRALRNNLGILMSDVAVEQAVGDRRVATSDLLPHLFEIGRAHV